MCISSKVLFHCIFRVCYSTYKLILVVVVILYIDFIISSSFVISMCVDIVSLVLPRVVTHNYSVRDMKLKFSGLTKLLFNWSLIYYNIWTNYLRQMILAYSCNITVSCTYSDRTNFKSTLKCFHPYKCHHTFKIVY